MSSNSKISSASAWLNPIATYSATVVEDGFNGGVALLPNNGIAVGVLEDNDDKDDNEELVAAVGSSLFSFDDLRMGAFNSSIIDWKILAQASK
jgi:hypothetical protein